MKKATSFRWISKACVENGIHLNFETFEGYGNGICRENLKEEGNEKKVRKGQ